MICEINNKRMNGIWDPATKSFFGLDDLLLLREYLTDVKVLSF